MNYKKMICACLIIMSGQSKISGMELRDYRQFYKENETLLKLSGLTLIAAGGSLYKSRSWNILDVPYFLATGLVVYSNVYGKNLFDSAAKGNTKAALLAIALGADVNAKDSIGNTPLIYAAKNNHLAMVKLLLRHRARINEANNTGETALWVAFANGYRDIAEYLLEHGADPRIQINGQTLLHLASKDSMDLVKLLFKYYDADINAQDSLGNTPLIYAANPDIVRYILEHGADVRVKNLAGKTAEDLARTTNNEAILKIFADYRKEKALAVGQVFCKGGLSSQKKEIPGIKPAKSTGPVGIQNIIGSYLGASKPKLNKLLAKAVQEGPMQKIRGLLDQGADVNSIAGLGWTPLMYAAETGNVDVIKMLLPTASLENQQRALNVAIDNNKPDVVALLLKNKALDLEDNNNFMGYTNLMRAVPNSPQSIRLLVQAGADIHAQNVEGQTARDIAQELSKTEALKIFAEFDQLNKELFSAIKAKNLKQVAALVEQGARIDARDDEGNTPLIIAAGVGARDIIDFLVKQKAEVNAQNTFGTTALIWAAINNKPYAVEKLLYAGADPNITDNQGKNTYNYARKNVPVLVILQDYANLPQFQRKQEEAVA